MKAVFFDVDGTLIDCVEKKIPASSIKAIEELRKNGYKVALATGRDINSIRGIKDLDISVFDAYVLNNGAAIYDNTLRCIKDFPFLREDVEKILRENPVIKTGIMHCYSGTPEMSKKFVEMGYYLGIGGPVTRYKDIQETVRITPIDKIVIETDSPVLPPEPFEKHSRNNSLYLKYIVNKIAEIKEMTEEDVIRITTKNAYKVYGI